MRLRAVGAIAVAVGLSALACSLVYPLGDFPGPEDKGGCDGACDAGRPPDAGLCDGACPSEDAAIDAPPYLGADCGSTRCNLHGAEVCCLGCCAEMHQGICLAASMAGGSSCTTYASCTSPRDCEIARKPDTVCCFVMLDRDATAQCLPKAACDSNVLFCDPTAPNPCPGGGTCQPSSSISGLSTCFL